MSREAHPEVEATTPPTSPSEELGPGAGAPAQSMSEAEPEGEGAPRSSAVLQEANAEVQATTTPTSPSQELGTGAGAPITQQAVALAGGWFRFWDEGAAAPYYYHPEKGTKWEEPPEAQAAHVAQSGAEPVAGSEPAEPGATAGQERYAYHDGYDWDTYASLYGYPSGYHAYWSYYWGGAAASMMNPYAVGPPGYHNPALAGGFEHFAQAQLESYPERPGEPECQYYIKTGVCGFGPKCRYHHPPREEVQKKKADCPYYLRTGTCSFGLQCRFNHPPLMTIPANSHTNGGLPTKQPLQGGSGGGIIYEPPPPLTSQAAGGDAMARLEGVLARAPGPALDKAHATAPGGEFEPHTPEEEPDAELTEAQKIFGVSDTFTPAATVAQIEQRSQAGDVGRIGETDPRHMTAEDIAASARRLEEEASASNAGILIDSKDVRRHGHLSSQVAVEKALLAKVQGNGTPAAEGYAGKASFNVRTGKFEGAGEVHKIAVSDPRRQTSHFFDYDKFAAEKNSKKARTGP